MTNDAFDDGNPTFRGTVYALVIVVIICAIGVAVGMLLGID